jgi:hypothetical protein
VNCPLEFVIASVIDSSAVVIDYTKWKDYLSLNNDTGLLTLSNYNTILFDEFNGAKIKINIKSPYFLDIVDKQVKTMGFNTVYCNGQTLTRNSSMASFPENRLNIYIKMLLPGWDKAAVHETSVSPITYDLTPDFITSDSGKCPMTEYGIYRIRWSNTTYGYLQDLPWLKINVATGIITISDY